MEFDNGYLASWRAYCRLEKDMLSIWKGQRRKWMCACACVWQEMTSWCKCEHWTSGSSVGRWIGAPSWTCSAVPHSQPKSRTTHARWPSGPFVHCSPLLTSSNSGLTLLSFLTHSPYTYYLDRRTLGASGWATDGTFNSPIWKVSIDTAILGRFIKVCRGWKYVQSARDISETFLKSRSTDITCYSTLDISETLGWSAGFRLYREWTVYALESNYWGTNPPGCGTTFFGRSGFYFSLSNICS